MRFVFVLVEPARAENIGSAARAIKTTGISELRLVNPVPFKNLKARKPAYASEEVLNQAKVFKTLSSALDDVDLSIATTAKRRSLHRRYSISYELPAMLTAQMKSLFTVAIVFGREESGLTNDEIRSCDLLSFIPMKVKYPSLNLAQSVMVYASLLSPLTGTPVAKKSRKAPAPQALKLLKEKTDRMMEVLNFHPNSSEYRKLSERICCMNDEDVALMLSIIKRLEKKI